MKQKGEVKLSLEYYNRLKSLEDSLHLTHKTFYVEHYGLVYMPITDKDGFENAIVKRLTEHQKEIVSLNDKIFKLKKRTLIQRILNK